MVNDYNNNNDGINTDNNSDSDNENGDDDNGENDDDDVSRTKQPFLLNRCWTTDMGWHQQTQYWLT